MAKMFPQEFPYAPGDTKFALSEKLTFEAFSSLNDDWVIVYSLRWTGLRGLGKGRPGEGEADFVLIHPTNGLLVAEVKGGKEIIRDENGKWFTIPHNSTTKQIIKDPFTQATDSKKEFSRYLESKKINTEFNWGHFVVFPGFICNSDFDFGPAGKRELIMDSNDLRNPTKRINEISSFWDQDRLPKIGRHKHNDWKPLTAQDIAAIRKCLVPAQILVQSGKYQSESILAKLLELTDEQAILLTYLQSEPVACVQGAAGTGKSLLARELAVRFAGEKIKTLFLCFNRPLGDFLKDDMKGIAGDLTVGSFHSFAANIIERSGMQIKDEDFRDVPTQLLIAANNLKLKYGAIIIDEAQDFTEDMWDAVTTLLLDNEDGNSSILQIFMDSNQNIYEGAGWEDTLKKLTNGLVFRTTLTINCRNTIPIAKLVNVAANLPTAFKGVDGPTPEFLHCSSFSEIKSNIGKILEKWQLKLGIEIKNVAVLTASRKLFEQCDNSLTGNFKLNNGLKNTVFVDTIKRFKGLERDAVILVFPTDADGYDKGMATRDEVLKLLYIGMSRAKILLTVIGDETIQDIFKSLQQ